MIETKEDIEYDIAPKTCSPLEACAICAFFVILSALAIYIMFAYPQPGY